MTAIKKGTTSYTPVCIGSGYFALDVVFNNSNQSLPNYLAGGSCGNVLTILAYWGWHSYPISRLGNDVASKYILKDIKSWGVKTKFIFNSDDVDTPIVIERIKKQNNGKINHKFEWKCPFCGSRLPHYRPVRQIDASVIIEILPKADIFYFDRISKGVFDIATSLKDQGCLIFFEPSSVKSSELFKKCIAIADIVKYSDERIVDSPIDQNIAIPLEIQTLGEKGLRFRQGSINSGMKKWNLVTPYQVENYVDSTGAGDWCTAGIIKQLGSSKSNGLKNLSKTQIIQALNIGQSYAALNCHFEGARGLMYADLTQTKIERIIEKIIKKESVLKDLKKCKSKNAKLTKMKICKNCNR